MSPPLVLDDGLLALGDAVPERVQWTPESSGIARQGQIVSAHWHRICDTLTDSAAAALASATQTTLDLVNAARSPATRNGCRNT